ncbi:hypothetical protein K437DRAFT_220920 [Tilletiaria anomala UBC 951]|uniref:PhoX domain-containing protein n=1 Tax=Tilletiaria anomala (strain ATCC 24038 / CBS 436.72 / UBC 951) TaxID=1037660 RepID=A0A066WE97_TILAU|nr:uncharacterized protein K437DRAFT_220920 [Tilletiaria anomala UBC 951]KDN52277.1 hypothetical protein K437DRAFT_220920 [Tilletiaria anomala UBC 951]
MADCAARPLHATSSEVSAAGDELIRLILRDFVRKWHDPLANGEGEARTLAHSPGPQNAAGETPGLSFPRAVEITIRHTIALLIAKAQSMDVPHLAMARILPLVTAHVEEYRKAELSLLGDSWAARRSGPSVSASVADLDVQDDLFVAGKYLHGRLHSAVGSLSNPSSKATEQNHLRHMVERALRALLPQKERDSRAVLVTVRELVACTVMQPIVDLISDPDFFNQLLIQKAGAALEEHRMVQRLREAIDKQAQSPNVQVKDASSAPMKAPKVSKVDNLDAFDALARSIAKSNSIMDVRRLRNDINMQIRKAKLAMDEQPQSIRARSQLEKLKQALSAADQKVVALGGQRADASRSAGAVSDVTLLQILNNPSSMGYFMEFMDRQRKSPVIQFWLAVESFKDPLEAIDMDGDGSSATDQASGEPSSAIIKTLEDDIRFFVDAYYSSPLVQIGVRERLAAEAFLSKGSSGSISSTDLRRARQSVLRAQTQVLESMLDDDWPAFKASALYHRAAEDFRSSIPSQVPSEDPARAIGTELRPVPTDIQRFGTRTTTNISASAKVKLFGEESASERDGVFGDRASVRGTRNTNLDFLTTTQCRDRDGRSPLFSEPLFDEEVEDIGIASPQSGSDSDYVQVERMDAIQHALTSIIGADDDRRHGTVREDVQLPEAERLDEFGRPRALIVEDAAAQKAATKAASSQNPIGSGQQTPTADGAPTENALAVVPVEMLSAKLKQLESQATVITALVQKAELTGAPAKERRVLLKSLETVKLETAEITWQRRQAELVQGKGRIVPGRTQVKINAHTIAKDSDGKEHALYLIEVGILAEAEERLLSGWIVPRRYSEFWSLHQELKDKVDRVRALETDLPGRRLVSITHAAFVETRRVGLERYLQKLIQVPAAAESDELRAFLAPQARKDTRTEKSNSALPGNSILQTLFKGVGGVAEGLDDLIYLPSMLDIVTQQLSSQSPISIWPAAVTPRSLPSASALPSALVDKAQTKSGASTAQLQEASSTASPLCDLLIEIFELKVGNNWLRRQAIVVLLQQLLAGTIDGKVREAVAEATSPPALLRHLQSFKDGLWPKGELKEPGVPRTPAQKASARDSANQKVSTLIPNLAANFIGRQNARKGVRTVFSMVQNQRLNKHLIYTILDLIFDELFPNNAYETC